MPVDKKTGLRKKPTYNELIEEIQLDEKIKLPNRQAMFLRNSPYLSFLDGETLTDMNAQQEKADKQAQVEHTIRQQAGETGGTASVFRSHLESQRTQENTEVFMDAMSDPGDDTRVSGAVGSGGSLAARRRRRGCWRKGRGDALGLDRPLLGAEVWIALFACGVAPSTALALGIVQL